MAAKFEISTDHAGKFRFHLKAPNGEIIAASQGYETKANAEKGIQAIKTHAANAHVEDHTNAKSSQRVTYSASAAIRVGVNQMGARAIAAPKERSTHPKTDPRARHRKVIWNCGDAVVL
jgi:uncharacterized protein